MCSAPGCNNIIFFMAPVNQIKCQKAEDEGFEFGQCGDPIGYRKSKKPEKANWPAACVACENKREEREHERYENAAKYVDKLTETERKRDDERRMREASRSATPRPAEQAAPVYGAGTGSSAGQGGGASEASGTSSDARMSVSAMPQELDVGPEHGKTQQGEDDSGEGSSQGQ